MNENKLKSKFRSWNKKIKSLKQKHDVCTV